MSSFDVVIMPRRESIKRRCCLTSVSVAYVRSACAAGRLDGAYWLIGPGSAGLAQGCRSGFRCRPGWGHIVAAARLQRVIYVICERCHSLNEFFNSAFTYGTTEVVNIIHALGPTSFNFVRGTVLSSDVNKTKFLRPTPRPSEVNNGTWRI